MARACVSCGNLLTEPIDIAAGGKCPSCLDDPLLNAKGLVNVGGPEAAGEMSPRRVAETQKMVLASIVAAIVGGILQVSAGGFKSNEASVVFVAIVVARVLIAIFQLVSVYRLAQALKTMAWLWATLAIIPIPLVELIILLVLNDKATKFLKSCGVPVGFLGVRAGDMPAA